ncbi:MAG: ABC transporter permease [Myxococcota bacterium]
MSFFTRVWALASKEVRHLLRDSRSLYLALGMPVLLLLLFGFGMSFDIDRLPIAFVDHDRSAASIELRRRFVANDDFVYAGLADSAAEAEGLLVGHRAAAVLVIDQGFERAVVRGEEVSLQLLVDGADNNTATQAQAKAELLARVFGLGVTARAPSRTTAPLEARTFSRFNPSGQSAVFLVPGVAAYVLAMVAVLLTALTVSREWERGSMAQLFATPVSRLEIVIGKLLPYMVIGALAVLLSLAVGMWVFDVPFRGSAFALSVLSLLFLAGMLGQGLLVSVVARDQMVATQVGTMTSMLPSMLLSGFVFPIENMPPVLQYVSYAIPARYYVDSLRGILLRGNGLGELWTEALLLAAFAALMIVLSTARFRRTIA